MPLATVDLPLRELCPQRRDSRGAGCLAVGRPERHQVVRLAVGHAAQFDRGLRFARDARRLLDRGAYLVGTDRLLVVVDDEPERAAPRWEPREVHDRAGHEHRVRDDDLTVIRGLQHRGAERDLLHHARLPTDLDGVADAERPLDENPYPGEKVLQNVLQRQPHDRILEFIRERIASQGYPPTVREIAEAVGLASTSAVHHHLLKLEREGKLQKDATRSRALTIPGSLGGRVVQAPIVGEIAAGEPIYDYA